ncbi:MAG: DUF4340 domain-containing protein [Ruminococcus flavefaciens]|nr:DUF4340 domain-containing protein [Ruminococcus flavefaciens]
MNKTTKSIIGLSVAVVVLGGGLAGLMLTEPKDKENNEESSVSTSEESSEVYGEGIVLIQDEKNEESDIKEVTIKNSTDNLHVVMKSPTTEESSATYTLDGYEDIPLNTALVGTLANNARNMVTGSIVDENCENLSKFGLDSPQAEVEVKFQTGTVKKFSIGDETPTKSETYVMLDGENTVYTVATSYLANYSKTLDDFVDMVILEEPPEESYPKINSLRIEREDIDYDIMLEYDKSSDDGKYSGGTSATMVMVEPTDAYLTVERSEDVTNGMFGLQAEGIYSIHCKESDIAEAGLKEPFCRVTMDCDDGNSYVLLMSEPFTDDNNKKCCYAMFEDGNIIYTVDTENAKWSTVMPIDITSRIMIGSYVWNITDMSVKTADMSEEFVIEPKDKNADNTKAEDFSVTRNGEVFDSERYRQFYGFLINASAEEFALDAEIPDTAPAVTVEYTDSYMKKTIKIEFYENTALTMLIAVDGKSKYICSKSYVDTLIENIKRIGTGEDYITTWK